MAKRKSKRKVALAGIVIGITLVILSFLNYTLSFNGFLSSVNSDIFGVGLVITLVSVILYLFKVQIPA